MTTKCRLIERNGTKVWLRVYWGDDCPSCVGGRSTGYHNAQVFLIENDIVNDNELGGDARDHSDKAWPTTCDHFSAQVPEDKLDRELPRDQRVHRQVFRKTRFNTTSGLPEPGDMFYVDFFHGDDGHCFRWDNCTGPHLYVILPNGDEWDVEGRASNCTLPKDRTHRCWVRHGEPPNVTVDKGGHTCRAGAGSIGSNDYHGFLQGGTLT